MAPRTPRGQTVPEESTVLELEDTYGAEPLNEALEKLYSEMNISEGVAEVYVYKITDSGNEARVWKGSPDDYDLDNIAKRFGSGEYRVKVYVKQESGRFAIKGNKTFHMLLDAQEEQAAKLKQNPQQNLGGGGASPEQLAVLIANAVSAAMPKQSAVDPMAQLSTLAGIMKNMMPGAQSVTQPPNMIDMLRLVMEVKQADKEEKEPLDKGVNASGMDVLWKLVDKFAPLFAQTLQPSGAATSLDALPNNSQTTVIEQTSTSPQPNQEMDAMNKLKMGLSFLVMQAAAGNDPATYAGMTIDNVPEEALKQIVNNPEWLQYLSQFEPLVLNHKDWMEEFRKAIIEEWTEPTETESPS